MAYENLKAAIKQAIKQNGNQEITGNLLQSTLLNVVNTVGADYKFLGFATPSTVPPTSEEGNLFYFAITPGNYSNFKTNTGNLTITIENGVFFFTKNAANSYWNSNKVFEIVQTTGEAKDKVMSQKAVSDKLSYLNCLNIHKYINNNTPISLEDAIKSVQLEDRKCSMEIAFRDSYDNVIIALYSAGDVKDEHFLNTKNWILYNRPELLSYNGFIESGEIWKNKKNGYYSIKASDLSNITDAPQGLSVSAVVRVFSNLNEANGIQILTSSKGEVWSRAFPKNAAENQNQWIRIDANRPELLSYNGFIESGEIWKNKKNGYYSIKASDLSNITDAPQGLSVSAVVQTFASINSENGIQILTATDGKVWSRAFPKANAAENQNQWIRIDANRPELLSYNGFIESGEIWKNKKNGYYSIKASDLSNITDAPQGLSVSAVVQVFSNLNEANGIQILTSSKGEVWSRAFPKANAAENQNQWYNQPGFLSYRGAITEGEIWKNKANGYYNIPADSLSNITDAPQGLDVSAVVQVFSNLNEANGIQILTSSKGEVWSRAFPKNAAENLNQWMVIHKVNKVVVPKTRWFALGDSITEGYYSEKGTLKGVTNLNYPYYVGIINDYETHNYGVGGSGYVHNATVGDHKNAKDKVDTIDFANCDLATLAWGVNDWHYNCQIGKLGTSTKGDGTMVGNMIYVIEKILNDNPSCKIVVILPSNSSKYGGNKETNWGLGSSLQTSGTLQNIIDKQKEVCEYYGIQFIDQTKNGIINRENIQSLLPDGLHPAKDGYLQIARFLSKQISFK